MISAKITRLLNSFVLMAIKYHPNPGEILICDFHGMIAPEMVKRRPVINLTPRYRRSQGLYTVVPISTTAPKAIQSWHTKVHVDLPFPYSSPEAWAKCDFLYTVSSERLFLFRQGKDESGKRKYVYPCLSEKELNKVWECVFDGLGRHDVVKMLNSISQTIDENDCPF